MTDGLPHIVTISPTDRAAVSLPRVPFVESRDEAWLQGVLAQSPDILPISQIDERVSPPLTSLGREIPTGSGPIDNLFISEDGYPVVVETKLWRNPEARRTVVAQILDYAGHLRNWSYSDLERIWQKTSGRLGSLWDYVHPEDFEESAWIDRVNENLTAGRMTLLIVGDGIRTEAHMLAEAVAGHPDFQFRLALVELRLYKLEEDRVLVLPTPILKTKEIERAIVTIAYTSEPQPKVAVELPEAPKTAGTREPLSEDALHADLLKLSDGDILAKAADTILRLLSESAFIVEWKSGSFTIRLPLPDREGTTLSLGVVERTGTFYFYAPWLRRQLGRLWNDKTKIDELLACIMSSIKELGGRTTPAGTQHTIGLKDLAGQEQRLMDTLKHCAELIVKFDEKSATE